MFEALTYGFMRNALVAGLLAGLACGIIGTYVVVKRIVFISGGISHSAYGGIGLGYFLGFDPLLGATAFSLFSAVGIGLIQTRARERIDTIIGILWAMGMSLGIIFINLTPGYAPDLMGYLFGSILTVPASDIRLLVILDGIIILTVLIFHDEFTAIAFDEEFAAISGIRVGPLYLLLLSLIGLTVVTLIRVVGIILVIALLTIPAAISGLFVTNLKRMMALSVLLGGMFTLGGLWISYWLGAAYGLNLPSGATIILLAGCGYLAALGARNILKP
ncbi:metal ABC transporter permease [candidate division KSB1 bacterium]